MSQNDTHILNEAQLRKERKHFLFWAKPPRRNLCHSDGNIGYSDISLRLRHGVERCSEARLQHQAGCHYIGGASDWRIWMLSCQSIRLPLQARNSLFKDNEKSQFKNVPGLLSEMSLVLSEPMGKTKYCHIGIVKVTIARQYNEEKVESATGPNLVFSKVRIQFK